MPATTRRCASRRRMGCGCRNPPRLAAKAPRSPRRPLEFFGFYLASLAAWRLNRCRGGSPVATLSTLVELVLICPVDLPVLVEVQGRCVVGTAQLAPARLVQDLTVAGVHLEVAVAVA